MAKSTCSAAAYINCRQEGIIITPPSVTLSDPWSVTTSIICYQLTTPTMKAASYDAKRLWSSAYPLEVYNCTFTGIIVEQEINAHTHTKRRHDKI